MATRPIFLPRTDGDRLVEEIPINFTWNPGFAPVQKRKNIAALHQAAGSHGYSNLLEVSTKSEDPLGQCLSAFNLLVATESLGDVPLECAFQASKVFAGGGPYTDLLSSAPRDARRDRRLRESGQLVSFKFSGRYWELEPKTAFYDWLYITAVYRLGQYRSSLQAYDGFTDIEFNPAKSINCQARSCAMFTALLTKGLLDDAVTNADAFVRIVRPDVTQQPHSRSPQQGELF